MMRPFLAGIVIVAVVFTLVRCDNDYAVDGTVVLSRTHEYRPKWSPSGKYILFYASSSLAAEKDGAANPSGDYPWSIFALGLSKLDRSLVYSSGAGDKFPNWHVNSESVVSSSRKNT